MCHQDNLHAIALPDHTWHCNSHTFARRLVMNGVDLRTVDELLGQRTIQLTMRYAHRAADRRHEPVSRLDQETGSGRSARRGPQRATLREWRNGRRTWFRSKRSNPWGFESLLPHQLIHQLIALRSPWERLASFGWWLVPQSSRFPTFCRVGPRDLKSATELESSMHFHGMADRQTSVREVAPNKSALKSAS